MTFHLSKPIAIIIALIAAISCHFIHAQDTVKTFVPIVNYTADLVVNTRGGIKTGAVYQGYAEAGVEINPWKNGQFNLAIASTHGGRPTGTLIGDWQEMDNKEASNHIFALNAWYRHTFGKISLKAGLQDVNDVYSTCDASGYLQNTAFGGNAAFMSAGNVPTMPTNGLGLNAEWHASNTFMWQAGIFNGSIIDLDDDNRFNLKHKLGANGWLFVSEGQLAPPKDLVLKVGAFYHTGLENYGFYSSFEKLFHIRGARSVNAFVTGGYAPHATDAATAGITCGATLTSLFSKSGNDALSAGLATAYVKDHRWEKALELNYRYQLNRYFYFSPDVQWILNPMGCVGATNALAFTFRVGFSL